MVTQFQTILMCGNTDNAITGYAIVHFMIFFPVHPHVMFFALLLKPKT